MRIGIIIFELNNGGSSYQLVNLAKHLKKKKHNITIYTLSNRLRGVNPGILDDLTILSSEFALPHQSRHNQIIGFFLYVVQLFKQIFALRDVVAHDSGELDILNPHDWPSHLVAFLIKLKKKIPIVFICNDVWFIPGFEPTPEERLVFRIGNKYLLGPFDKLALKWIDKVVVLDNRIKKIIKEYYGVEAEVVRSGIDLDSFKNLPQKEEARKSLDLKNDILPAPSGGVSFGYPKKDVFSASIPISSGSIHPRSCELNTERGFLEASNNDFIFLCFAIFLPHRRFEDAILAFKMLLETHSHPRGVKLVIAGSDSYDKTYREYIESIVEKEKLDTYIEVRRGYVAWENLVRYLVGADVFVFPNEKQTWGLTVIEAMAAGTPCIVSSGAGVHEVIQDKKNGLIFPARNVESLFQKMDLLYQSKELTKQIGKNAQAFVFQHFSWEKFTQDMLKIFIEVNR